MVEKAKNSGNYMCPCNRPKEGNRTSAQIEIIRGWRKEGIKPDDKLSMNLRVDHPSPRAVEEKARTLKRDIQEIQTLRFRVLDKLIQNGMREDMGYPHQRNLWVRQDVFGSFDLVTSTWIGEHCHFSLEVVDWGGPKRCRCRNGSGWGPSTWIC